MKKLLPPPSPTGQGWGDGSIAQQFHRGRRFNAENTYTGFRPRVGDIEGAYFVLRDWCADPRIRRSFSSLFNSLMIPLKVACENTTEVDEHGRISIEANFGRIVIE